MNKRRLLKLADLLEADAKNKNGIQFNLGTWGLPSSGSKADPGVNCGTMACALGLAALSGKFKRAGLSFSAEPSIFHGKKRWVLAICHRKNVGSYAASSLFEIPINTAEWLFLPSHYRGGPITGKQGERRVAKRIRDFVAGKARP